MKTLLAFLLCALPLAAQVPGFGPEELAMLKPAATQAAYTPGSDATVVEWLKADAISASDNDDLATWPASIGNNATQGTGASQPRFKTNQKNSLPAVFFHNAGADRWMETTSFGTLTQPFEVWIVCAWSVTTGLGFAFDGLTSSDRAAFYRNGTTLKGFTGTDLNSSATADTSWHIVRLVFNGSSSSITLDNGTATTGDAGGNSFVGMTLGASHDQGLGGQLYIGEIFVRNAVGSDTAAVWSYLNSRWAVY